MIERKEIDCMVEGVGPTTVLLHSSVSGARQWRKLVSQLSPSFHLIAINLWGYGATSKWDHKKEQRLDDHVDLIELALEGFKGPINLVGHSFGGSVAMKAAERFSSHVNSLILLEPNPFLLLRDHGRDEAYEEVLFLRDMIKTRGTVGQWAIAAECFADYWGGIGVWAKTPADRRCRFIEGLKNNFYEWDAILSEPFDLQNLDELMPDKTLVVYDKSSPRPINEIVSLLQKATCWEFERLEGAGHMAPLTHPLLVNPIIERYLKLYNR